MNGIEQVVIAEQILAQLKKSGRAERPTDRGTTYRRSARLDIQPACIGSAQSAPIGGE